MAWSPQARAVAIVARRAHAHGPKISMTGHHGIRGRTTQPVNQAGYRGQQIKRYAKTAAKVGVASAVVAGGAALAYREYHGTTTAMKRQQVKGKIKNDGYTKAAAKHSVNLKFQHKTKPTTFKSRAKRRSNIRAANAVEKQWQNKQSAHMNRAYQARNN